MVKKLLKHELFALGRVLVIMQGILLAAAVFTRILLIFETDHFVYDIIRFFTVLLYGAAVLVNLVAPLVMAIVRYYRNLFTAEGYLTFSLPLTPAQHLLVKALGALIFQTVAGIVVLLSAMIVLSGDVLHEVCLAAAYLLKMIPGDITVHLIFWILEFVLLLEVTFVSELMLYYGCVSIGQLARKNRILVAVGVYFGYYVATQVLSTIVTVLLALFGDRIPFDRLLAWAEQHPELSVHIVLCSLLVFTAAVATGFFFVSHTIIRKRLNLE